MPFNISFVLCENLQVVGCTMSGCIPRS